MTKKGETSHAAESVSVAYSTSPEPEYPVAAEDHEKTAQLAYSYWQARGCPIGSPEEDWYRAENELRKPIAAAAGS
jgi:hypothetical protein